MLMTRAPCGSRAISAASTSPRVSGVSGQAITSQSQRGSRPASAAGGCSSSTGSSGLRGRGARRSRVSPSARARRAISVPILPSPRITAVCPAGRAATPRRAAASHSRRRCAASQCGKPRASSEQPRDRGLRDRHGGRAGGGREPHAAREHLGVDRVVHAGVEHVQPLEPRRLADGGEKLAREIREHVAMRRTPSPRARTRRQTGARRGQAAARAVRRGILPRAAMSATRAPKRALSWWETSSVVTIREVGDAEARRYVCRHFTRSVKHSSLLDSSPSRITPFSK